MPIRVTCPACGFSGKAPHQFLGRSVKCRQCGARFSIAPTAAKRKDEEDTVEDHLPEEMAGPHRQREPNTPAQEESHK